MSSVEGDPSSSEGCLAAASCASSATAEAAKNDDEAANPAIESTIKNPEKMTHESGERRQGN